MLKAFCDKCGAACKSSSSTASLFESLDTTKADLLIGLQVLPTFNKQLIPDNHICDECLPDLLLKAAKTFSKASVVRKTVSEAHRLSNYDELKVKLENRLVKVAEKEKNADDLISKANELIASAEKQKLDDSNRISVLLSQINTLQNLVNTRKKQSEAAEKQAELDRENDPEYVDRIRARERLRAS